MIRRLALCISVLLCAMQASALTALVGHSIFYVPDGTQPDKLVPSVETYWQIEPSSLHYTTTSDKTIIARIKTDIWFLSEAGIVKEDHFILQTPPRQNVSDLMSHSIIDLRQYSIVPGLITMKLLFTDLADTTQKFSFTDTFTVRDQSTKPFYSDIQLLDTTLESPAQTAFNKNGHQQVPTCVNFLDDSRNLLHYYAELYQANTIATTAYPVVQKIFISRKELEGSLPNLQKTDTITPQSKHTLQGDFPIWRLPSGNYYLNTTLENNQHVIIASRSLFFQRLNTHPIPKDTARKIATSDTGMENITVLNLQKTFVAKYSIPQTHAILKMILPVSDPMAAQTINMFLRKPDDMYIRYFIYNYFLGINSKDPAKAWKEYSEKIKEVNKLFSERGAPGYETERGQVYLRYGKPTDIITVENENGALPYEVWQYNVLTQMNNKALSDAVFLFYKTNQSISGYRLLHSSVGGEVINPSWRTYLYTNEQGGTNINSRAEQYIGSK